jgi:hypothetical protein
MSFFKINNVKKSGTVRIIINDNNGYKKGDILFINNSVREAEEIEQESSIVSFALLIPSSVLTIKENIVGTTITINPNE